MTPGSSSRFQAFIDEMDGSCSSFPRKLVGGRVFGTRPMGVYLKAVFHWPSCSQLQSHTGPACQAPEKSLHFPTPTSAPSFSFPSSFHRFGVKSNFMVIPAKAEIQVFALYFHGFRPGFYRGSAGMTSGL